MNAVSTEDWGEVLGFSAAHPQSLPFIGVHPWWIGEKTEAQISALRAQLTRVQCGIGEIGLDFSQSRETGERQEVLFKAQIGLAKQFERPVTIHCVRAWHRLLAILKNSSLGNRPLLFHSFGGSQKILEELLEFNSFFSFGHLVLVEQSRQRELATVVPDNRLLLESDLFISCHETQGEETPREEEKLMGVGREEDVLSKIFTEVSRLRNVPFEQLSACVEANLKRFTCELSR